MDLSLRGSIVAHRNDRMGGRLIAMLNAIRIARDHDLPFHVGWTTHGRTSEELRDPAEIFDQAFVDKHFFGVDILRDIWAELIPLNGLPGTFEREKFIASVKGGANYLTEIAIGCAVLPWEDAADVAARLPSCMEEIAFNPVVRHAMGVIDAKLAGKNLFAYHIRRGDIIRDPITSQRLWPNKYIPRVFYEAHLQRVLGDEATACIVFSDTVAETNFMKAMDPRVLTFEDILADEGLHRGQRDFLELYTMSRCKEIFGPPESAFSQTAATIGGGTVHAVEEALRPEERGAALDLLSDRLEHQPSSFLGDGDLGQNFPFMIRRQFEIGKLQRATSILTDQAERGFSRPYVFQKLAEIKASSGEIKRCEKVRELAYASVNFNDEVLALVNAYASMGKLKSRKPKPAMEYAMAGFWLRPLEPLVGAALNLLLSADAYDHAQGYPCDAKLIRNAGLGKSFGEPAFAPYGNILPEGVRPMTHPWEIVVRDWKTVHGKKLNRAFSNLKKIERGLILLQASFSRMGGTPELESARAVLIRDLGHPDKARVLQEFAIKEDPENPLYHKRLSDVLQSQGDIAGATHEMEAAAELASHHPAYLAGLALLYKAGKRPDKFKETLEKLAAANHLLVEVHLMTAEWLRRTGTGLEGALAHIQRARVFGHRAIRLMFCEARILLKLGNLDEAAKRFGEVARDPTVSSTQLSQIYRELTQIGLEERAKHIVTEGRFGLEEVTAPLAL